MIERNFTFAFLGSTRDYRVVFSFGGPLGQRHLELSPPFEKGNCLFLVFWSLQDRTSRVGVLMPFPFTFWERALFFGPAASVSSPQCWSVQSILALRLTKGPIFFLILKNESLVFSGTGLAIFNEESFLYASNTSRAPIHFS